MRYRSLCLSYLAALALAVAPTVAQTQPPVGLEKPLITYQAGGSTMTVSRDGSFAVSDAAGPYLGLGQLILFGADWKSASQRGAAVVDAKPRGETALVTLRLTEPTSGLVWQLRQTVTPVDGGWRIDYEAEPAAETNVTELSLVLDLPQPRFAGLGLSLHPREEVVFPAVKPAVRHFVQGSAERYIFARGRADQMVVELDQPRLLNVQDTREFGGAAYQAFVKLATSTKVKPGEALRLGVTVRPEDTRDWLMPRLALDAEGPLVIGGARWDAATVGQRHELDVRLSGTWSTPFWAEQIALDAVITAPDGQKLRVPGFYALDYDRSLDAVRGGVAERLTPRGQPSWRVRWLPSVPGRHHVELAARDRSGTTTWSGDIDVAAGTSRPFLRVSPQDEHYFEFEDGRPYFANGLNVCWYKAAAGTADYDRWFGALAGNGGNYARLWMPSWAFGFEWGKPGVYKMDRAAQMDYVVDLAQAKGIYLKVCLENFRTFDDQNPYAKANGGPCETVLDVFANDAAKRQFRNRLRYAVARWGWSPNVMAWELWNEIDCVQGYKAPVVQAWAREMCAYLKEINPRHLTVNSLGSFVYEPELWSSKEIDFAQMHGYWHPSWKSTEFGKDMAQMMADHVAMIRGFGKPAFFAEFGLVNQEWGLSPRSDDDKDGVNLHNGMWGAMMAGGAGVGHLWWWDNYVEPKGLWYHYKGVAGYIDSVPWTTAGFEPFTPTASAGARAMGLRGKTLSLVWVQNRAHTWWNVAEKKPVPPVEGASVTLPGAAGRTIEVWDTYTGARVRSFKAEGDQVLLGTLEKDIAIKVLAP